MSNYDSMYLTNIQVALEQIGELTKIVGEIRQLGYIGGLLMDFRNNGDRIFCFTRQAEGKDPEITLDVFLSDLGYTVTCSSSHEENKYQHTTPTPLSQDELFSTIKDISTKIYGH